jgi:hypothetical protein
VSLRPYPYYEREKMSYIDIRISLDESSGTYDDYSVDIVGTDMSKNALDGLAETIWDDDDRYFYDEIVAAIKELL